MARIQALVLVLAVLLLMGPAVIAICGVQDRDRVAKCSENLSQLWKTQNLYMSKFGGKKLAMPPDSGSDFWLALARTAPPLIDKDKGQLFQCPVKGIDDGWGTCSFRGPNGHINSFGDGDPVGADIDGNHGSGKGGNVLQKAGDVSTVSPSDYLWKRAATTTTGPGKPKEGEKPGAAASPALNGWVGQTRGVWHRVKVSGPAREIFRDTGLKTLEGSKTGLLSQTFEQGRAGPVEDLLLTSPATKAVAPVTLQIQGREYSCDLYDLASGEKRWILKGGKHAGATLKSESPDRTLAANRLWDHSIKLKEREYECLVVEAEIKTREGTRAIKTWHCATFPMSPLKVEIDGVSTSVIDFGPSWSKRPPFPGTKEPPAENTPPRSSNRSPEDDLRDLRKLEAAPPGPSDKSSEEEFRKVEATIENAKTLSLSFKHVGEQRLLAGDAIQTEASGTVLLREENRLRLSARVSFGREFQEKKAQDWWFRSDGSRIQASVGTREIREASTPRTLKAGLSSALVRMGPFHWMGYIGLDNGGSWGKEVDFKTHLRVSGLRAGLEEKGSKSLIYRVTIKSDQPDEVFDCLLVYDPVSFRPLRHKISYKSEVAQMSWTVSYEEVVLDAEIPDGVFSHPEK